MARQAKPDGKKPAQSHQSGTTKTSGSLTKKPDYKPRISALFQPKAEVRSSDIVDLVDGVVGLYAFPGGGQPSVHVCVREVETSQGWTPVASITHIMEGHSLFGQRFESATYVICSWLFNIRFKPVLTDQLGASTQQMIHNILNPIYSVVATQTPPQPLRLVGGTDTFLDSPKKMGPKELAKMAARQARAVSDAVALAETNQRESYAAQCAEVGLHHMRTQAVTLIRAVSGRVGYVDMSGQSGDLMIQVTRVNSDPKVKVMKMTVSHISTHHTLWIQGVRVGDSIGSGHLMCGDYGQIDVGKGGVHIDRASMKDILIRYIQSQLRTAGIHIGKRSSPSRYPVSA